MNRDTYTSLPITSLDGKCTSPTQKQLTSRIPVVSPSPLRRWNSMRDRRVSDSNNFHSIQKHDNGNDSNLITDINRNSVYCGKILENGKRNLLHGNTGKPQSFPREPLRRGISFIERGEKASRRLGNRVGRGNEDVVDASISVTRPKTGVVTTEPPRSGGLAGSPGLGKENSASNKSTRNRSLSLSISKTQSSTPVSSRSPANDLIASPRTPPSSPEARNRSLRDWDTESIASSITSSLASCEHATVARNGTTFSGRSMKYVVHCPDHSGAIENYLTPTQRAHRQVKRLKLLLEQAQKELEQKDSEILKLTKEVVELRLYKAALNSPEDRSTSSDAVTVKENNSQQITPIGDVFENGGGDEVERGCESSVVNDVNSSCADSGHFEDFTSSSVHSKDSVYGGDELLPQTNRKSFSKAETKEKSIFANFGSRNNESEHNRLILEYEKRIQELVRTHEQDCHELKQKHNDKVEELLTRLSEINAKYWELVPDLEAARERIKELEEQLEEASKKLEEQEEKHKENCLKIYTKGHEAARLEQEKKVTELALKKPSRLSVPELLHQLQVTQNELENVKDLEFASSSKQPLLSAKEAVALWVLGARKAMYKQLLEAKSYASKIDPEITLQFLKSAVYYFLTDKENSQGHLRAIQSILGFTESEINNIDKARQS